MTTATQPTDLARIVNDAGLPIEKADALMKAFAPLVELAGELVRTAETIKVTDASQLTEMKQARDTRLKLVKIRTGADAARKELKADVLKIGTAIQAAYNWLEERIKPVEKSLQDAEDFAKNLELKRKAELKAKRLEILQPFGTDTSAYRLDEMTEQAFNDVLTGAKAAHQAKLDAEIKADEERLAAAQRRREEQERVQKENERLRLEAAEREKAAEADRERTRKEREAAEAEAAAERQRLQAIADAERKAREKLEREQRDAQEAERARQAAEAEAARKAANAPDKDKILAVVASLRKLVPFDTTTEDAAELMEAMVTKIESLASWIEREANQL